MVVSKDVVHDNVRAVLGDAVSGGAVSAVPLATVFASHESNAFPIGGPLSIALHSPHCGLWLHSWIKR